MIVNTEVHLTSGVSGMTMVVQLAVRKAHIHRQTHILQHVIMMELVNQERAVEVVQMTVVVDQIVILLDLVIVHQITTIVTQNQTVLVLAMVGVMDIAGAVMNQAPAALILAVVLLMVTVLSGHQQIVHQITTIVTQNQTVLVLVMDGVMDIAGAVMNQAPVHQIVILL